MTLLTLTQPRVLEADRAAPVSLLTGEELLAMGDVGNVELVKGDLIKRMPTGYKHGIVEFTIGSLLRAFVRERKLGQVLGGETGLYTRRNPDTVRGMDVAYISTQRLAQVQTRGFLDVAPELIVEILSPTDRWMDVTAKVDEYFVAGARMVWLVNAEAQQVFVYRAPADVTILGAADTLTGANVLPGFSVPVAELLAV